MHQDQLKEAAALLCLAGPLRDRHWPWSVGRGQDGGNVLEVGAMVGSIRCSCSPRTLRPCAGSRCLPFIGEKQEEVELADGKTRN